LQYVSVGFVGKQFHDEEKRPELKYKKNAQQMCMRFAQIKRILRLSDVIPAVLTSLLDL
jgi:hypothetical protein